MLKFSSILGGPYAILGQSFVLGSYSISGGGGGGGSPGSFGGFSKWRGALGSGTLNRYRWRLG